MPKASTASISFSNLESKMVLDFSVQSTNAIRNPVEDHQYQIVLARGAAIPASLSAGPINIGLTWEIVARLRFRLRGAAKARLTFSGGFPGHSALVTADFVNPDNRKNTGWDHFKHKPPKTQLRQLTQSLTADAGFVSSLVFGFDLPNIGKLDLKLKLPIPQIKLSLKGVKGDWNAAYSKGLC